MALDLTRQITVDKVLAYQEYLNPIVDRRLLFYTESAGARAAQSVF
jgi:hypothetical protein